VYSVIDIRHPKVFNSVKQSLEFFVTNSHVHLCKQFPNSYIPTAVKQFYHNNRLDAKHIMVNENRNLQEFIDNSIYLKTTEENFIKFMKEMTLNSNKLK